MFILPVLNYSYDALEPFIDAKTLEIHHSKHHQTYVTKLNTLLEGLDEFLNMELEDLLQNISKLPENKQKAAINNGGQVYNHNIYWQTLAPHNPDHTDPAGKLLEAITVEFGSFGEFKERFAELGANQFGSGWVWLYVDKNTGKLALSSTSNADSPIFEGHKVLMTMDVWEHAYYLNYQNRRPDYITAFWNVVNWQGVEEKFEG